MSVSEVRGFYWCTPHGDTFLLLCVWNLWSSLCLGPCECSIKDKAAYRRRHRWCLVLLSFFCNHSHWCWHRFISLRYRIRAASLWWHVNPQTECLLLWDQHNYTDSTSSISHVGSAAFESEAHFWVPGETVRMVIFLTDAALECIRKQEMTAEEISQLWV